MNLSTSHFKLENYLPIIKNERRQHFTEQISLKIIQLLFMEDHVCKEYVLMQMKPCITPYYERLAKQEIQLPYRIHQLLR